jgi:DNA topoisomerase-3
LNINISTLHNTHSNAAVTTTINNRNNSNNNLSGTNQNLLANETVSMRSYHTMPASDPISGRPTHFSNHKQEIRNSRNQDDPNNTRDDNEQKVCYCSMPAALLTVRKEGANQGKQFYGCGNNKSCDFFMV